MKTHERIIFIGSLESPLKNTSECPKQGFDGAPDAIINLFSDYIIGIENVTPGTRLVVLTWLHQADRTQLKSHPRGDKNLPKKGVFLLRSPHRPNPVGIHEVTVIKVESPSRIIVSPMEVVDGTPVVDIKISLTNT